MLPAPLLLLLLRVGVLPQPTNLYLISTYFA